MWIDDGVLVGESLLATVSNLDDNDDDALSFILATCTKREAHLTINHLCSSDLPKMYYRSLHAEV